MNEKNIHIIIEDNGVEIRGFHHFGLWKRILMFIFPKRPILIVKPKIIEFDECWLSKGNYFRKNEKEEK